MAIVAARADALTPRPRPARLWAEFAALYLAVPLAIAVALPPRRMFAALAAATVLGLVLLAATGTFRWSELVRGWRRVPWGQALAVVAAVLATGVALLTTLRPEALWALPRHNPGLMLAIWALYPLLSALPQELVFRALFFHRYALILPRGRAAIALNAAIFSFAHLMYWSWVVAVLTFVGGWFFARAYLKRGFPSAWVLHAAAGNALFTVGMGVYFYSGNVVRPF